MGVRAVAVRTLTRENRPDSILRIDTRTRTWVEWEKIESLDSCIDFDTHLTECKSEYLPYKVAGKQYRVRSLVRRVDELLRGGKKG